MPFEGEKFEEPPTPPSEEEKEEKIEEAEEKPEEVELEKEEEMKKFEMGAMEVEKVKMGIDREWSKEREQELNELKERNKERFEKLNFDLENLELYVGDIYPNKGECKSFFEIIIIDKPILFDPEIGKDCVASHEISHYLINQKLPQEFFNRHPGLREKKRDLFKAWVDKKERLPPLMRDEFIEKIKDEYWIGTREESTSDNAIGILEKFVEDFQKFKPKSIKPEFFEKLVQFGIEEKFLLNFNRGEPFKNEEEYERQAIMVLGQLGELLSRKVAETEAEKYNISWLQREFIEEGASNYLAAKLLDIPLDKFPYEKVDGISIARDWDRKLEGKIEPLIEAIKKGGSSFVELYKA